ncbi:hypothetical protein BRARA_A01387 [Brassica rapa]|uniref:BnaA01g13450D protein n=6 Tax=Brassica TaxID=3705 RepID=A0A078I9K9_BRANA|nr:subtilisin-like protease SBT2.5 [Brassica napus]KAF2544605.1 hypothetical protein F2Q68_00029970 [Brassica cretica]KAG2248785.1 hypothetical protein Bca52824_088413 [Brassica carinata]KAG5413785.1 hypothetical protein IGI04_001352 [Brassica rapa subsp. trilocularis]RID78575.1 hypothetical protein BRARA_A01387 [Brassica rapa]KAH0941719.1 hypothetical protein HID58_001356 [Brassica napus]
MESSSTELYYVFLKRDPEYERLKEIRTKKGEEELDRYLEKRHEEILESNLEPGSYKRTVSLVVVHGFGVEITKHQAEVLRSADGVYTVEKNEEIKLVSS